MAIIDPRTGRSMWSREGWTLENPMTAESFAEMAMDFCSRNSFDRPPQAPRASASSSGGPGGGASGANAGARKRPMHEMSEEDQIQAAMQASMNDLSGSGDKDDGDKDDDYSDVEIIDTKPAATATEDDSKPAAAVAPTEENGTTTRSSSFIQELLDVQVGDEPTTAAGAARLQLRMPDGKRVVRKFDANNEVKVIYAFVAVRSFTTFRTGFF